MGNRITDQTTQNGLIDTFKLKGDLPEMEVSPIVQPIVEVARLDNSLTVSDFTKWSAVFGGSRPLIDPADITNYAQFWPPATSNIAPTNALVMPQGNTGNFGGNGGCALPGGSVGNHATDGIYRITLLFANNGGAIFRGNIKLTDQAAFGLGVALGTVRSTIGTFTTQNQTEGTHLVFDMFLLLRTTLQANAVVFEATTGVNGTHTASCYVQKLIDEIPGNVIFP